MCTISATKDISFIDELSYDNTFGHLNDSYILPKDELQNKKLAALAGNPDDAWVVASYYGFFTFDDDESIKWHTISAENGYQNAQYMLANILLNFYIDHDSKTRGIFWLYQMAKNNFRETVNWLHSLNFSLETAQPPDDKHFLGDFSNPSETVIADYKTGALQGNKQSALILGRYYEKIDEEVAEYWYRIGAQNDSSECQYELSQVMSGKEDEFDKIRGKYWLDRSRSVKK
jgi:TPR repeat protein